MELSFLKYQSLGNDFILLDFYKKDFNFFDSNLYQNNWSQIVQKICKCNFGVGADGVLVSQLSKTKKLPELLIFNSDGTQAELCLNGLRCAAKHLFDYHNFANNFEIEMGSKIINVSVICKNNKQDMQIITKLQSPIFIKEEQVSVKDQILSGYIVDIGNPHFIIFEKTNIKWLKENGHLIESNKAFKNKTNVEFVWLDQNINKNTFSVLVYERGCGYTLACSSGAASVIFLLNYLNKSNKSEEIVLQMPGGKVCGWVDEHRYVALKASADLVFDGNIKL